MLTTHPTPAFVLATSLLALACGAERSPGAEPEPTDASSGAETGEAQASETGQTETGQTDAPESETGEAPTRGDDEANDPFGPACGDAAVDAGEACDDGNDVDGDGCNRDCRESGMVVWEHRDVRSGAAYGVDVSPSGAIYVVGQAHGLGVTSAWAGRVDASDGEVVWTHELATPADASYDDALHAVDALSEDGVLMGGRHDDEGYLAVLGTEGGLLYEQPVATNIITDLAVLDEGDLLVTNDWTAARVGQDGVEWSTQVGLGLAHRSGDDVALAAQYSPVGLRRFTVHGEAFEPVVFPMPEGVSATSSYVAWTSDGEVIVAGDVAANNAREPLVLRMTTGGHLRWAYGPQQLNVREMYVRCLAVDAEDAVVVGGYTYLLGAQRPFVMKLSAEGEVSWTRSLELAATNATVHGCTTTPADEVVAVGSADGHLWFTKLTP